MGKMGSKKNGSKISLKTFISNRDEYVEMLQQNEKSKNTIRNYVTALNRFMEFIERHQFTEVNKDSIICFKHEMQNIYMPATANLYITGLNGYLRFIQAESLCVKTIQVQRKFSIDTITVEEYAKMLNTAKSRKKNDIYYIMRTLASTGMRIAELEYLTMDAVNSGECKIINKNKLRYVLLIDEVRKDLLDYCSSKNITKGYVFFARNPEKVISEVTVLRRLKRVAVLSDIDQNRVYPHNLRHLFAKRFLESAGNLNDLADILGHSRIETTRIYTRTSLSERRIKLQNLGL